MCCCCPPAITALFYLWVRSGFSKDAVAGALVFFPPEPALYKFKRIASNGDVMPDIDDEAAEEDGLEEGKGGGGGGKEEMKGDEDVNDDDDSDSDSDLGTFEIDTKSSHQANNDANHTNGSQKVSAEVRRQRRKQREEARQKQRQQYAQDPIAAITDRSNKSRLRAKRRAKIDSRDHKNGVTYQFVPDIATLGTLPSFQGSIQAVKIGPQKRTGSYIAALLYQIPPSEITPNTKTILYSHGNAADIGAMSGLQAMLAKNLKCNVLVYDYSGYGESGGIPMEKNTYRDVKLVYEWVVKNVTQHEHNVILYGQSVGSGPSCYLASRRSNVGGLVLHSPFTSGMRVLTPSRAMACLDIFPNIDRIKKVKCPVFIIHGQKDQEVAFEHGMALQAAVPEDCKRDPWWVREKGHNDICDGPDIVEYMQRMNKFVKSLDE